MPWGGGVYGAPTGGYDYPFLREAMERKRMEEEERQRQMLLMSAANSPNMPSTAMVRGIPFPAVPAPAQRNLPPLVAPRINEPQLSPVLEEIRAMRRPVAEMTAPLETRIAELEQQRSTIERPSLKNALFETGLGMMASRAPTALGALGQSGLGALQNFRAMKQQARAEEQDISKQIGATGAQIAAVRGRQEQDEFNDAMQRLQQLHGSEVVRAQTEDATARANRREQEEALDRQDRYMQQQYGRDYGVAMEQLRREMGKPTPEEREQKWRDYQRVQDYETKKNIEQGKALQRPLVGSGSGLTAADKRMLQQGSIDRSARSLIIEQLQQGWVDPRLSPTAAIDQARQAVQKNLKNAYPGMNAAERKLLLDSVGSFTANKDFEEDVRRRQSDRRTDAANKLVTQPAAAPVVDDLGLPKGTGKPRSIDMVPQAGAAPGKPAAPAGPVAVFDRPPWEQRPLDNIGIRVNAQAMPAAAPAAPVGMAPDAGRQMMEYFGGADPDDPAKAGLFQGFDPKLIQAYRDYRAGEGRRIRY